MIVIKIIALNELDIVKEKTVTSVVLKQWGNDPVYGHRI